MRAGSSPASATKGHKMPKVYVDKDSHYSWFMWDEEMLEMLPQPEHLLVETTQEFVDKYVAYQKLQAEIYQELEKLYESKCSNRKT